MRPGLLVVLVIACGAPTPPPDAGPAGFVETYVPTERRPLGLNDVTYLLPLPGADAGVALPRGDALVPRALFDRLTTQPGDVLAELPRFVVVAARFELCDRPRPGPCSNEADGVLRLVLQPVSPLTGAEDVALHAFYPVPRAEVYETVDELRALGRLQDLAQGSMLQVNRAFGSNPEFTARLSAFLGRTARLERLFRLTLFGQLTRNAALIWVFRGLERRGDGFVRLEIPDVRELDQVTRLFSATEVLNTPQADAPAGFRLLMAAREFMTAPAAEQRQALDVLEAIDNPTLHTSETVQCVSCHIATTVRADRARVANVDLTTLPNHFSSNRFDLTPLGDEGLRFRTLRALGWFGTSPLVSARVVNESAAVVDELEARFPPAR
ncbi:MAG: hypothetical protein SFW67_33890 [Myxococcaceae bacterium]|nr:hypothetical protein [Myxococcaceae bacterium]